MAAARGGKARSDEPHIDAPADVDVVATFEGMGLKQNLLRGIFEFGYEKPTAIQQRAIVPMTAGRDVIAQAQSGTGKTSMLSIAALQVINLHFTTGLQLPSHARCRSSMCSRVTCRCCA